MSLGVGQLPPCGLCEHMFVPVAEATILHADADAFFASVEQRDDPSLRGRPVAVGPGVVMAASYEAKACGVHGGMHIRQARRLCPDIVAVPSRFDAYVAASRDLFEVFRRTVAAGRGPLDGGGVSRRSRARPHPGARRPRSHVACEPRCARRSGSSSRSASRRRRSWRRWPRRRRSRTGSSTWPRARSGRFSTRSRSNASGASARPSATRLRAHGIATVGDVAAVSEDALAAILGRAHGARLHAIAAGGRFRPVRSGRSRRSFGAQRAIGLRRYARSDLERSLDALVDRVTRRMRKAHRVGRTVILRMRFGDFARASRSHTLHARDRRDPADPGGGTGAPGSGATALRAARVDDGRRHGHQRRARRWRRSSFGFRSRGRTRHSTPRSTSSASGSARRASPGRPMSTAGPTSLPTCSPAKRTSSLTYPRAGVWHQHHIAPEAARRGVHLVTDEIVGGAPGAPRAPGSACCTCTCSTPRPVWR